MSEGSEYEGNKACALIGKVEGSEKGEEFYIGKELTFEAPLSGRFYLGVSDIFHLDNEGAFVVAVKIDGKRVDFRTGRSSKSVTLEVKEAKAEAKAEGKVFIDLNPYVTWSLTGLHGFAGNDLGLQAGKLQCEEIEFQIGQGMVQLAGQRFQQVPEKVEGIKVGLKLKKLHFLHATGWGTGEFAVPDGTQIGSYVIHYEDGSTAEVPVKYGVDVRDWWTWEAGWEAAGANAAWTNRIGRGRLYLTTWKNPHPDKVVTTIDCVSASTVCAPFLVAMTAETEGPAPTIKVKKVKELKEAKEIREAKEKGKNFIDLDPYVNSPSQELQAMRGNSLPLMPGEQRIADTVFRIGNGVIQLSGPILEEWAPGRFSQQVKDIKVGLKFKKLHILHATGWGAGPHPIADGSHIGNYVIHYEDASTEEVQIKYGNHVRDWWSNYGDPIEVSEGKVARITWNRRLFVMTWENPHPDKVVTTMDYVSAGTVCAPFLVAITAETEGRAPTTEVEKVKVEGRSTRPEALRDKRYEETFSNLYHALGRSYPCFALKGIDWKRVGEELLPRARDTRTDREFGLLCAELVARLEDSHAYLMTGTAQVPRLRVPQWDPGFACLIGNRDKPVVYYVDKG